MDGGLSPAGSGSEEPPPSVPGVDAAGGYLQEENHAPPNNERVYHFLFKTLATVLLQLLTAVKGLCGSLQHLQRERCDDVGLASDGLRSLHGLRSQRGDHLSAVDQGQALQGRYEVGGSHVS